MLPLAHNPKGWQKPAPAGGGQRGQRVPRGQPPTSPLSSEARGLLSHPDLQERQAPRCGISSYSYLQPHLPRGVWTSLEQGAVPSEMAVGAWRGAAPGSLLAVEGLVWLWRNLGGLGSSEAAAPHVVTVLAGGSPFTHLPPGSAG